MGSPNKYRCGHCQQYRGDHLENGSRLCPDGSGRRFKHAQQANRASGSWSADEVELMHQLLTTLQRGGDARGLTRAKAWGSVARRVQGMRDSIARRKAEAGKGTSVAKEAGEAAE